jgi:hypothetical protein
MPNKLNLYDLDKDLILRDRISRYINLHPYGVSMSELETIFGESRMRLGYILNKLHEDSRIRKTSNVFYPIVGL